MYGTAVNDMHPVLTERERLQNLADENAKLRTQLADVTESVGRVEERCAKLREYAAKAWSLFIRHGAVHACDLSEVDAVRDGLRELGIEVPS